MASDADDEIDRLLHQTRLVVEELFRRDDPLLADPAARKLAADFLAAAQDWFEARAKGADKGEGGGYPADIG